jgi:COMPASS component SWD3
MINYSQRPRDDDAMLGSSHFAPTGSLMLGGIKGLKQQFKNHNTALRIQAIEKAVNYENKGVDLIIEGLKDRVCEVQKVAYLILEGYQQQTPIIAENQKKIKEALNKYIPYPLFEGLSTLKSGEKCVLSNQGNTIAFFTGKKIRVFDLLTKELLYFIPQPIAKKDFFHLTFDPNLLIRVCNTNSNVVEVWEQGELIFSLYGHPTEIKAIATSEEEELLATASQDGTIKIWHLDTGKPYLTFRPNLTWGTHKGGVNCLTFSDNGHTLISSSQDGTVKLWDLQTGAKPRTLKYYGRGVKLSPDGIILAVSNLYGQMQLISLTTGKILANLKGHTDVVETMIFSPYGRVLITGAKDKYVKFWSVHSGHEIHSIQAHQKAITGLALTRDHKQVITVSEDYTVKRWGIKP